MSNDTETNAEQIEVKIETALEPTTTEGGGKSNTLANEAPGDLKTQVDYLKAVVWGVAVVVAVGFIINLFDIYSIRFKYFDEYQKRVGDIEKQNINLENKIKYETATRQDKENLQKQLDCFKGKKYWQYEQCFKQ
jgi:hypothetical protein